MIAVNARTIEAPSTQRDLQVSFLKQLQEVLDEGAHTHDRLFGFCTPDVTYIMALDVEDDDEEDLESDWLADLVVGITPEPVTGFAVGFMPLPGAPVVFTTGRTAAGGCDYTTLVFGRSIQSGMPPRMGEYMDRQARILWGEAWSPLP